MEEGLNLAPLSPSQSIQLRLQKQKESRYNLGMKEYINCNQYGIRHNKDEIVKKYRDGVVAVSPKQTRYFKDKEMMTLHRVDGPAVEYSGGVKLWYVDGKQHRTDGPAVVYSNGSREWYVDGAKLTEEEFKAKGK